MSRQEAPVTPHVYAGPYLERASERRTDAESVARALGDPATRFVPVWQSLNLLTSGAEPRAALLSAAEAAQMGSRGAPILLGDFNGATTFAIEIGGADRPALPEGTELLDLRPIGALLPSAEAGLLAYARAMLYWRQRHTHCGVCGRLTEARDAGHVMVCTDPACATETFPRLDPAIIVLAADDGRALLGRQASWAVGVYSTIAGFVEPGESLEDAVAREVREETGVELLSIRYHSSQPWPFPSSLMVGFLAVTQPGAAVRPGSELEDARFFSRAQIAAGEIKLPTPLSISYRLIEAWYDQNAPRPLAQEPNVRKASVRR